mmetsp:Transcript_5348/g.11610  ORF Transcript_5348/g.11610 Transcript_5348/m.11610 type:complete len:447 (+) Transcript_5348:160-1500(+)
MMMYSRGESHQRATMRSAHPLFAALAITTVLLGCCATSSMAFSTPRPQSLTQRSSSSSPTAILKKNNCGQNARQQQSRSNHNNSILWNAASGSGEASISVNAANANAVGINGNTSSSPSSTSTTKKSSNFLHILWRFTRPHTIIGSAIAIPSIFLLASPTYADFFTGGAMKSLAYAAFPSLLMNLYITGLNQITDVEIDKINKPNLPMATGELNYPTAIFVVVLSLAISLAMSLVHPTLSTMGLQVALWGSFLLGTMYSLPPIRMKRHPFLAAFCIVAVRGTIINAGFYSHALSSAFGGAAATSGVLNCLLHDWKCKLSSFFFGVFGIVIALMKDVPDAHGDRIFNIRSFTVRMGQKRIFHAMKNVLMGLFGVFGAGLLRWATMSDVGSVEFLRRGLVGLACWTAGWTVNKEAKGVDPEDSGEVYNYYMYLWKLFYMSYLALPFVK